jgi:mannose-6-phosphate isomerase-like protein (cupin superfamily)
MEKSSTAAAETPNYRVKNIEPVMMGSDVQARMFTLAPGDTIPWHYHKHSADHYFVLEGALTVVTRKPEKARTIEVGNDYKIPAGADHLVTNRSTVDCRFLLLQGIGKYDWVKAGD